MRPFIQASVIALASVALAGCASTQLNYNTEDVSAHVSSVYVDQALNNLSRFIDDPYAIPAQTDLSGGTVQIVNTIQPSISVPFTAQIANSASGMAASALTLSHGSTIAGSGATLGGSNAQQQNYNFNPVVDANTLRNLQALYRYAIHGESLLDRNNYRPARVYFNNRFYFDPYQLQRPQCVVCSHGDGALEDDPRLFLNPDLHSGWLHWSSSPNGPLNRPFPAGVAVKDLGHYGDHELYMSQADFNRGYLSKFIFFTMPNQQPAEAFTLKVKVGEQTAPAAQPPATPPHPPGGPPPGPRGANERRNFELFMPYVVPTVPQSGGRTTTPSVPPGIQY